MQSVTRIAVFSLLCLAVCDCSDDDPSVDGGPDSGVDGALDGGPDAGQELQIANTLLAGFPGLDVVVTGTGLTGRGEVQASLEGETVTATVTSDGVVTLRVPEGAVSGDLTIRVAGETETVPLEVYEYTSIPIPPTPGTNAKPLSIDIDDSQRVWINQEFHRDLHLIEGDTVAAFPIPVAVVGPFASEIFGDRRTTTSVLGEDVEVSSDGSVWFTQGGASLYMGEFENHSRIVQFLPETQEFRAYNVPGDQNEVIGLALDPDGTIWFAQGNVGQAALWHFDPARAEFDNTFEFTTSLDDRICSDLDLGCFERFPLTEENFHPAHLFVDGEGDVWFTQFFGNRIGVLDRETLTPRYFPTPASDEVGHFSLRSGPWEIFMSADGQVVFNEFFNNTIGWMDASRRDDPLCFELNAAGQNPCIRMLRVDDRIEEATIHSIVPGPDGRVWFTASREMDGTIPTSVGFVIGEREVVTLPALRLVDPEGGDGQNGIAIDPVNGDIWFTEFWNGSVGRLSKR